MNSIDPFGRTDKLDGGMLEAFVVRFEARGKHPLFSKMLQEYLGSINIGDSAAASTWAAGQVWRPEPSRAVLGSLGGLPALI